MRAIEAGGGVNPAPRERGSDHRADAPRRNDLLSARSIEARGQNFGHRGGKPNTWLCLVQWVQSASTFDIGHIVAFDYKRSPERRSRVV
jgi:hypothetical protein